MREIKFRAYIYDLTDEDSQKLAYFYIENI